MPGPNLKAKMLAALDEALADRVKAHFATFAPALATNEDPQATPHFRRGIINDLVAYDAAAKIINEETGT